MPNQQEKQGAIAANAVSIPINTLEYVTAIIELTGPPWVGTIQFEYTPDGGTNWYPLPAYPVSPTPQAAVTSATANGVWRADVAAFPAIRVRSSVWTSGTATVQIEASAADARLGGITATAATIADGADVAQGTTTDAATTTGNGTVVGHLRRIRDLLDPATTPTVPLGVGTVAQNAAVATGLGTPVATDGYLMAMFAVSGVTVATVSFEASNDGGATWVPLLATQVGGANATGNIVASTAANGYFRAVVAGIKSVRARISAYTSGTITVTVYPSVVDTPEKIVRIDQLPAAVALADAAPTATTATVGAANALYNGATWDAQRGNSVGGTLLASASRTTQTDSATQTNYNARGVMLSLNITSGTGTGGLNLVIVTLDPVSGAQAQISQQSLSAPQVGTGLCTFVLYPGVTERGSAFFAASSVPLPRTWFARVTVGNANAATYSLGYQYIV